MSDELFESKYCTEPIALHFEIIDMKISTTDYVGKIMYKDDFVIEHWEELRGALEKWEKWLQ